MRISGRGVAAGVVVLLIAGVCVRLGFWQLSRLEERRTQNAAIFGAISSPIQRFDRSDVDALLRDPSEFLYRRVRLAGSYIPGGAVILRGRAREGRPGVHLIAPLVIENSDATILVNRGWLPAPDAASVDPRPHALAGPTEVTGIILPNEGAGEDPVPAILEVDGSSVTTYQRIDFELMEGRASETLLPVILQQLIEDRPADPPYPVALSPLDEGPHLSYAVQWFSFAVIALVGFLIMALRRRPSETR